MFKLNIYNNITLEKRSTKQEFRINFIDSTYV